MLLIITCQSGVKRLDSSRCPMMTRQISLHTSEAVQPVCESVVSVVSTEIISEFLPAEEVEAPSTVGIDGTNCLDEVD
jgi:hypothetical protein